MSEESVQPPAELKGGRRKRLVRAGPTIVLIGLLLVGALVLQPVVRPRNAAFEQNEVIVLNGHPLNGALAPKEATALNVRPVSTAHRIAKKGRQNVGNGPHANPRTIHGIVVRAKPLLVLPAVKSDPLSPPAVLRPVPTVPTDPGGPLTMNPQELPVPAVAVSHAPNPHFGNPGRTMHRLSSRGTVRHV